MPNNIFDTLNMEKDKITISSDEAKKMIVAGKQLCNFHVLGELGLDGMEEWLNSDLIISNCTIENFNSAAFKFDHHVRIEKTKFIKCVFNFARFHAGLLIDSCEFENYLDFSPGGHNEVDKVFTLKNSVFNEFVSFFDCWFQGRVEIVNNNFRKGTNLLGNKDQTYVTQFDIPPKIQGNIGAIDIDGEGDKKVNTIYIYGVKW